ncbi:major capsid protein [Vibrio cholerae]|uniref:major capsid protein n=1 Tax=Vibrio cholerae TaxID=666 RepID=UPI00115AE279|nr:major capsid protein [Vibrio cholerae]TQO60129.1 hypothetical protein FLM12_15995 [Vibrio cholerae]
MVKQYITRAVALGSVVVASASHAAIDVTAATTQITTDGGAAISTIGGAMIGLAAVAVVFKWAKAAIFG